MIYIYIYYVIALRIKALVNYLLDREISNLSFADDIDLITGRNGELQELTNRLIKASKEYRMEVGRVSK